MIIETEESLHLPGAMFGYIVPRVKWLQQGVSNTLSKVDSGYNGRLLVTLFNLGKKTVYIPRFEPFCSLVIHDVGPGARLYDKDAKSIEPAAGGQALWQRVRNRIEAHPAMVALAVGLVYAVPLIGKLITFLIDFAARIMHLR